MPVTDRIRLRIDERQAVAPCCYREPSDPPGASRLIPLLRLSTLARVDAADGTPGFLPKRALVDTGAWLSAIETDTWRGLDRSGLVEHLPFAAGIPAPALIGGRSSAYRLGRVWIALVDLRLNGVYWLPAVPVVAQLLLDPACTLSAPILLGLHQGVLDGRRLTREVVPVGPSALATDCGPRFAQEWHLESP